MDVGNNFVKSQTQRILKQFHCNYNFNPTVPGALGIRDAFFWPILPASMMLLIAIFLANFLPGKKLQKRTVYMT